MKATYSVRVIRDYPRYGFELSLDKTWAGVSPSLRELIKPLPTNYLDCFRYPEQVSQLLDRLIEGQGTVASLEVELSPSFRRAQLTVVREGTLLCGYLAPEPITIAQERLLLQNQVSALYRSGNQIITIMDHQHRIVDFNNQAALAAFGRFGRVMSQGECFTNYVQEDRLEDFTQSFDEVMTGKTVVKERDIFAADGVSHRYEMMYTPIYDSENKVSRVCFSAIDIEERRQMARKLEQEQGFVSAMLNTTNALIFATDTSGRVLRWNQACQNLTGHTLVQIQNVPLFQSERVGENERQKLSDMYQKGEPFPHYMTFSLKDSDGEAHPVFWSIQVSHAQDLPTLVVFTGLDMTQQKQAEEALEESESLLRQAQKMEAVGISAGSIAHDFNNLLTAIQGYSELLAMNELSAENRELNAELLLTCRKAKRLTRQLLLLSRRESEEQSYVDVSEVLEENLPLFQQLAGSGVKIHLSPLRSATVFMNRMHLEQICLNLITNARDAMDARGEIGLSLFRVTLDQDRRDRLFGTIAAGRYVGLVVEDTGPGVPEDVLPRIFEPFFTTKVEDRGTGLGLALIYRIVKKAGGWVDVKASPKTGGAVFEVYLPFGRETSVGGNEMERSQVVFYDLPEEMSANYRTFLSHEDMHVYTLTPGSEIPEGKLVVAPFNQTKNPQVKAARTVLYIAQDTDIETEAFDQLQPHEDVLVYPFSHEQLKYRILAMLG